MHFIGFSNPWWSESGIFIAIFTKDGLSLIPELMDEAIMKANVLADPVKGRDEIANILETLESLYASLADIDRTSTPEGEFIFSQAYLLSGEKVSINIIGERDKSGWIASIEMTHAPPAAVRTLSNQLSAILHPGNRAA